MMLNRENGLTRLMRCQSMRMMLTNSLYSTCNVLVCLDCCKLTKQPGDNKRQNDDKTTGGNKATSSLIAIISP